MPPAPPENALTDTPGPAAPSRARGARRWVLLGFGCMSLALGGAGVFLPLVPTVPFLVLAVWCFARSSDRLERWILEHSHLGPAVRRWREHGVVSLRAKGLASLWLALSTVVAARSGGLTLGVLAGATCGCVALFLWTRPSRPSDSKSSSGRCPDPGDR